MSACVPAMRPGAEAAAVEAEARLLAGVRSGDEDACAALVRLHGGRMLATARRLLGNDADAADAVQEAFLAAFRALDDFHGQSSLATWLHRIALNAALGRLRRRARQRTVSFDDLLPSFIADGHHALPIAPWGEQAEAVLARQETRAQVRACINRLPEPYRTIVLLRDIEELDTEETARQLGISPGAVKTRLHRARQALRTLLEPLVLQGEPA